MMGECVFLLKFFYVISFVNICIEMGKVIIELLI